MKGKGFGKDDWGKGFGKDEWGKGCGKDDWGKGFGWAPPGFMSGKGDWGKGDWGKGDWFMPGKGEWGGPCKGKGDWFMPGKGMLDKGGWGKGMPFKGGWGGDPHIENYLEQHNIQDHAADEFRQLPPSLQRIVIEVGSLADARDPTAVLMSRMKKAQNGMLNLPDRKPGDWNCPKCGDHNFARNSVCRRCDSPNTGQTFPAIEPQWNTMQTQPAMDPQWMHAFLMKHRIEDHAVDAFRDLSPEMQQMVIDAGSLDDARDPTAVLLSRISKARSGTLNVQTKPGDWRCLECGDLNFARNESCRKCGAPKVNQPQPYQGWGAGAGKGGMADSMHMKRESNFHDPYGGMPPAKHRRTATHITPGMVEQYIERNRIEEHAAEEFTKLAPDLQSLVMDAGSLQDARSPTAVLMSRIKKAKRGELQAMEMKPGDWKCANCGEHNFQKNDACRACGAQREGNVALPQHEAFLQEHNIEEHAAGKFRMLPSHMQAMVMDAGSLADARDPTAVLMSRIRKAMNGELKVTQVRPGDWTCPQCGEHNFGKNKTCRKCGYSNEEEGQDDLAEEFLANNEVEQHAADALRELPSSLQKIVMEVGGLNDARDPTAVLLSRIKKARHGELKVVEHRPGDWSCPSCGFLNFARNDNCRKCDTPRGD